MNADEKRRRPKTPLWVLQRSQAGEIWRKHHRQRRKKKRWKLGKGSVSRKRDVTVPNARLNNYVKCY